MVLCMIWNKFRLDSTNARFSLHALSPPSVVSLQVHETGVHVSRSKLQTFSKSQQLLTSVWLQNTR